MNKAPAYLWYPKDILTSIRVAALSDMGELWYRRALDYCWLHEQLPADPLELAKIVGRGCTVKGAKEILHMFERNKKDSTKLIHDRHEQERKKYAKNRRQKAKAGRASAAKRREEKQLVEQQKQTGTPTHVEQPSTDVATESNIPIPISFPIPTAVIEEEKREEAPPPVASDFGEPENKPSKESLHSHPVIEALRTVTKRNPEPAARQHLINKVGGEIDLPKLHIAYGRWKARGYKDTNFDGILDFYLGNENGTNRPNYTKRTDADVIRESTDFYEKYPS